MICKFLSPCGDKSCLRAGFIEKAELRRERAICQIQGGKYSELGTTSFRGVVISGVSGVSKVYQFIIQYLWNISGIHRAHAQDSSVRWCHTPHRASRCHPSHPPPLGESSTRSQLLVIRTHDRYDTMIQNTITIIKVCGIVGSPVWVAHSIIAFCPHKGTLTDYFETVEVEILCFCEFTLFINIIETNPEVGSWWSRKVSIWSSSSLLVISAR